MDFFNDLSGYVSLISVWLLNIFEHSFEIINYLVLFMQLEISRFGKSRKIKNNF